MIPVKNKNKNKINDYLWFLLVVILVVSICIFLFKIFSHEDSTKDIATDSSLQNSQVTDSNQNSKKVYRINPNNIFRASVPSKDVDLEKYDKVHKDAVRVLEEDGFEENEMNYDKGISYRIVKNNEIVGYKMEWVIPIGCKLVMGYSPEYILQYSRIGCH